MLLGLALGFEYEKDLILVCYGERTPQKLLDLLTDFPQSINLTSKAVEIETLLLDQVLIILDITKDPGY